LFRGWFSGASIRATSTVSPCRGMALTSLTSALGHPDRVQWPTDPGDFGVNVDPLGEVLMLLLPEGFMLLLAPAVMPPALPVVVELPPAPVPVAAPVPAPPAPAPAAKAIVLESASAVANTIVVTFMDRFLCRCDGRQTTAKFRRSSPVITHPCDVSGVDPADLAIQAWSTI
jgi:hypothetical protein